MQDRNLDQFLHKENCGKSGESTLHLPDRTASLVGRFYFTSSHHTLLVWDLLSRDEPKYWTLARRRESYKHGSAECYYYHRSGTQLTQHVSSGFYLWDETCGIFPYFFCPYSPMIWYSYRCLYEQPAIGNSLLCLNSGWQKRDEKHFSVAVGSNFSKKENIA